MIAHAQFEILVKAILIWCGLCFQGVRAEGSGIGIG